MLRSASRRIVRRADARLCEHDTIDTSVFNIEYERPTCHPPSNVIERKQGCGLYSAPMVYFWPVMGYFSVHIVRHKAHREIWCCAFFCYLLFTGYFRSGMRGKLAGGVDYSRKSFLSRSSHNYFIFLCLPITPHGICFCVINCSFSACVDEMALTLSFGETNVPRL